jgi:hypothetical protein
MREYSKARSSPSPIGRAVGPSREVAEVVVGVGHGPGSLASALLPLEAVEPVVRASAAMNAHAPRTFRRFRCHLALAETLLRMLIIPPEHLCC